MKSTQYEPLLDGTEASVYKRKSTWVGAIAIVLFSALLGALVWLLLPYLNADTSAMQETETESVQSSPKISNNVKSSKIRPLGKQYLAQCL